MWSKFKAMPVAAKILIIILAIGVLGKLASLSGPNPSPLPDDPSATYVPGAGGQEMAQLRAQQAQLQARTKSCVEEMNQSNQTLALGAINGSMTNNRPDCEQYMPQWIAQEATLEKQIYRLQTGDTHSTMQEITGIQTGSGSSSSSRHSSAPLRDGTEAVDDWDRGAIRGHSLYTDENGREYELDTRNYYFRDRASGQLIGSDQPDEPNDGRDYETLQNRNPPQ